MANKDPEDAFDGAVFAVLRFLDAHAWTVTDKVFRLVSWTLAAAGVGVLAKISGDVSLRVTYVILTSFIVVTLLTVIAQGWLNAWNKAVKLTLDAFDKKMNPDSLGSMLMGRLSAIVMSIVLSLVLAVVMLTVVFPFVVTAFINLIDAVASNSLT